MFTINLWDILSELRTPGGDHFTEFVDALITAEAYIQGLPISEISTNLRTNLGDEGVDTEARQAMLNTQTGWMSKPTCWQYKATEFKNISKKDLREEVNKKYAKTLIQKGYGYRLCICDDLTPVKKSEWESILDYEIAKINSNAPNSKVITASDLARWANQYPSIIVRFFKPSLINSISCADWGEEIRFLTDKYVEVKTWATIKQQLIEHLNFNNSCQNVIFSLQGEAGVGKTRFVYETVSNIEGANNLVLYAIDEKALEIVYPFLRDKSAKLILVVDECLLQTKQELKNRLKKEKNRIRVICIDNSGERLNQFREQIWLERIPNEDVDAILKQNFPTVTSDHRRAYVNLSEGFIRFAADLCDQDSIISAQENIGSVLSEPREYLINRLNDEQLSIVEAISLFQKVGYRDEVEEEHLFLCTLLNLTSENFLKTAKNLKDVPGYVAFSGRYLYITPAIIAHVSFAKAWETWIEYNPPKFLDSIPQPLLDAFLHRVSASGSEEVRRIVGDFFQHWASQLQPIDLSDFSTLEKFIVLININPEDYLPQLANLVNRASKDELLKMTGGYRGTRRSLVWLAEKMAAFPEFFSYAELILWKLALAETELNLANNATHIWQQLFRIYLSGTAVPFSERIKLLETRLFSETEEEINLALECLNKAFYTEGSRILGSPIVAGRIPPENWQPQTQAELKDCLDKALTVVLNAARSNVDHIQTGAFKIAIDRLPTLLAYGYLEQIKALFSTNNISQEILVFLIRRLEDFLQFNSDASEEIQQWLQSLIPEDFHGKLIQAVGKSPWNYSLRDNKEAWQQEINNLAQQLYEDRELLKSEIEWLTSPQAIMVENLGRAIGQYDVNADCLDIIMGLVAETEATGLARGYIVGLLNNHPQHTTVINEWIDQFETQIPTVAYELFRAGGSNTKAVERALKLVDTGSLSLEYLGGFFPSLLSYEEFYEVLKRLFSSIKKETNQSVTKTATKLIAYRLEIDLREGKKSILEQINIQNLIWQFLEATANYIKSEEYNWEEILRNTAKFNLEKAVEIASLAILSKNNQQKMRAEQILVDLAKSHPDLVMEKIGQIILDDKYRWHFKIEKYRFLIQNLPLAAIKQWLNSVGVTGARRISKQLALPYLDNNNQPVVPELTEFVLSKFEDDEETFRNFCISSHNLQVYLGDTVAHKNKEAEIAKSFLNHQLRRIREWASYEIESSRRDANYWRQISEEDKII
ncbi:hypothetical protein [Cyanobacterium sp. Dongsha4]|uniref:hypothetical protein n=1 Tax=Cyanobacterium sp. DS4 TaxID=2878255 RepID=UPI002E80CCEC|nr:hypothetical protein [Cyanobacterium sp. Dongsha4]WVL02536.1 hypothetical protein Dongsha4_18765 [Cyanobacterium sp. Dongsha4]